MTTRKNSNNDGSNAGSSGGVFTLLIVDDSSFVRAQVKEIMRNENVHIIEAVDGEEAWKIFDSNPDIHFVLSDVNMPRLDGVGFLERVCKKNNGKPSVPVVMLTTETNLEKVILAKKLGAAAWMLKPPVAADLLKVIRKFLAHHRRAG